MISFIDEKGKRHSALATIKRKKAVNGEKSLEGTIYTNDEVINKVDLGWKMEFEYEKYVITYAQPVDNGDVVELEFDAVHEFFYDFLKSSVYATLNGSNTMRAYLDFIFTDSGYSYILDDFVPAFSKENFGMQSRLSLFNEIIKSTGAEFVVNGRVVRIMYRIGRDLSTVVRKGFNMQDIIIEKNIKDFITYRKGYGAFFDEEDESLGRLEVEYESPLSQVYGRLEGAPVLDERYSVEENLYNRIKESVDSSYEISVQLTMEDLTRAGYDYEQPQEGDYIMAINEDIGFRRKVRIVSYISQFDTTGELIDHQVTCNSIGLVQSTSDGKLDAIYDEIDKIEKSIDVVYVAANGKNMVYRGPTEPTGDKLVINDLWYKPAGNGEYEMRMYTGAYWELIIIEDARFNNLDANNITFGTLRGYNFQLDLDNDFLLMGENTSDYKLLFDGDNLLFGEGVTLSWGNIDNKPSIPTKAEDIGARPDDWTPTASDVGARPSWWVPTPSEVGALPDNTYIPTESYITTITENTIKTGRLKANYLEVDAGNVLGELGAANISVDNLIGNTSNFVRSSWNDISSDVTIESTGIRISEGGGDSVATLSSSGYRFWMDGKVHGRLSVIENIGTGSVFSGKYSVSMVTDPGGYLGLLHRSSTSQTTYNRALGITDDGDIYFNNIHPDDKEPSHGFRIWNGQVNDGTTSWKGTWLEHKRGNAGIFFGASGNVFIRTKNGIHEIKHPSA